MFVENNIYKTGSRSGNMTRGGLSGLSSRQQVLFLMQKTQKEANWNMENDSDFQEDYSLENRGNTVSLAGDSTVNNFDNTDLVPAEKTLDNIRQNWRNTYGGRQNYQKAGDPSVTGQLMTYNEEFEVKREELRKREIVENPMRFRLLAYSLTQFIPLRKNKYLERKRYMIDDQEAQNLICTCERFTGRKTGGSNQHQSMRNCGESCLNRVVSFECCPWTCPCGPYCKNQKFQLHQNAYVYPVKTEFKGWGLLAGEFIKKGSFIMQYVGEIISVDSDLGKERVNMYKNSTCTYLMKTTANEVIDPTFQGNIARFINHSCDPNCETNKWKVLGEVCVGIFAKRDIQENEELTFDYQFDFFKTPFTKCYCGAAKCKGYLGVLATNISSDTSNPQISAPECNYCKGYITEKESLIVCRGSNKETYHISCVIKKEGGRKRQQNYEKNLDSKNFVCRICHLQEKNRIKSECQESAIGNDSSSDQEMTSEIVPDTKFPWNCSNPDVLRYYEDSQENQILDLIIKNEVESLNKEYEMKTTKKKRSGIQKYVDNFSTHYNFMQDLQKRLKQRIKQQKKSETDGKLTIFRRPKQMVFKNQTSKQQPQQQKIQRRRGKRATGHQQNKEKVDNTAIQQNNTITKKKATPTGLGFIDNDESYDNEEASLQKDVDQPMKFEVEKQNDGATDQQYEEVESEMQSQQNIDEYSEDGEDIELELDQDEDGEIEEEGEQEMSEEISAQFSDEDDSQQQSNEDLNDDEEEVEEEIENELSEELNLEELQQDYEMQSDDQEDEEEESKSSSGSSSSGEQLMHFRRQRALRLVRDRAIQRVNHQQRRISIDRQISSQSSEDQKPSDQQVFLSNLQEEIAKEIGQFVKLQNSASELKGEQSQVCKETKLNTYETVFNLAVPDYIEDYQCLPNFQIYWEQAWGGVVTIKIVSTFKQYQFFTQLLQRLTDLLIKKGMLRSFNQVQQHYQVVEPPQQYPFEIIIVYIPKNFLRKIVGYQDKNLSAYRRIYQVDFDYNKEFLSDDVYGMDEMAQVRVFGSSREVRHVNELILKNLEQLQMKTIIIQMSECKLIMENVKEVKLQVDPCEIRIKKVVRGELKDMRHPFYFLPIYSRELVLIGTDIEIKLGEKVIEKFLQIKREQQKINLQQICYLLPIQFKNNNQVLKNELIKKYGQQNLQVFFYEPSFPRKHMTVLLIGDWKLLLNAKKTLQQEVDKYINPTSIEKNFDHFQQYTYHQQIRYSFKSLKRFVLERDIKYLNHWDMISSFVEYLGVKKDFIPEKGMQFIDQAEIKRRQEEHKAEVEAFIKYMKEDDAETCINTLFVLTESKPDILEKLMKTISVRKKDIIEMMFQVLKANYQSYNNSMTFVGGKNFFKPYTSNSHTPFWQQNQQSSSSFFKPYEIQNEPSKPPPLISSHSEPNSLFIYCHHRSKEVHKPKQYEDDYRHSRREEDLRKEHYHRRHLRSRSSSRSHGKYHKFQPKYPMDYQREEQKYQRQQNPQQHNYEHMWHQINDEENYQISNHREPPQPNRQIEQHQQSSPSDLHQSPPQIVQGQQKLTSERIHYQQSSMMQDHLSLQRHRSFDNRLMPMPSMREPEQYPMRENLQKQHSFSYRRSRSRDRYWNQSMESRRRSRSVERGRGNRELSHSRGRGHYHEFQQQRRHHHQERTFSSNPHRIERRRSRSRSIDSRNFSRQYHRDDKNISERGKQMSFHQQHHRNPREEYNTGFSQRYHHEKRERSPIHSSREDLYQQQPEEDDYMKNIYLAPGKKMTLQDHLQMATQSGMNQSHMMTMQQRKFRPVPKYIKNKKPSIERGRGKKPR